MSTLVSQLIDSPEVTTAVDWWSRQLMGVIFHDAGDLEINLMTSLARSKIDKPSERHVDMFRKALTALTAVLCANSWNPDEPNCGSAVRTLATDYGPDNTLSCALDFAGIRSGNLLLPIKTVMWISPSSVKVRPGYYGKEVQLFLLPEE